MRTAVFRSCASVLLIALLAKNASAQSLVYNYWTGSGEINLFTNAANWSPSAPLNSDYQSILVFRSSSLGSSDFAQTNRTVHFDTTGRQVACVRFEGMTGWNFTGNTLQIDMSNDGQSTSIYANTPGTNTFSCNVSLIKGTTKVDIAEGSVILASNGLTWNSIMARVVGKGTLRVQGAHNAYSPSNPPTVTNGVVELAASTGIAHWQCSGVGVSKCFATSQVSSTLLASESGFFDCNGYNQSPASVGIGLPMPTSNTNHGKEIGGTVNASNATFTVGTQLRMGAGTILGRTNDVVSLSSPTFVVSGTNTPSRIFATVRSSSTSTLACITNSVTRGSTPIDLDVYGAFVVANQNVKGPFLKLGDGVTRIRGDLLMTNTVASGYSIDVAEGTFLFDGTGYLRSPVAVRAGAAFGGAGTVTNALSVPATATLVPGNETGRPLTCRGGLTLASGARIAMSPAVRSGGIAVTGGTLSVSSPVTVRASLDGVENGDYTVLDVSAAAGSLTLSDFTLEDVSVSPVFATLTLKNGGTRLVLQKGNPPTVISIR